MKLWNGNVGVVRVRRNDFEIFIKVWEGVERKKKIREFPYEQSNFEIWFKRG